MAYRDDLTALAARHEALSAEVASKTRELQDTQRLLDQAQARARLPVLDNIRIASPCSADWDQMTGDERTRHCWHCDKNVYNLSGMTRDEAEALLHDRNGDLCVRYYQRADGTILLADCTVGVKRRRRRRFIAAGAAALLAGGAAATNAYLHSADVCRLDARDAQATPMTGAVMPPPTSVTYPVKPTTPTHIKMGKPLLKP